MGIEFNGKKFFGWQIQKELTSVQATLEIALSKIADHSISVISAGRTDSGVHSIGQVVNFHTKAIRNDFSWISGTNSYLPEDISIKWIKLVPDYFNARHHAISRSYKYVILNSTFRSALFFDFSLHVHKYLDVDRMHNASQYLLGEHDFSSFRSNLCQSLSPIRKILRIKVFRKNSFVIVEIKANSFLYHMVRNIVGSLLEIGKRKREEKWLFQVLNKKDRKFSGPKVLAKGLYLVRVNYPSFFKIPESINKSFIT
ncbi:tRNA pseudouridine(38-40) synthase TruA [Buchnera aphidicola (Mindarus keteleerifoliae)]|uniref:tRNA pseudouridine(38-40) synthase TruA n=1 Tax=Buchnera aphidicola TaxID=9 RepID=UPI0031B68A37